MNSLRKMKNKKPMALADAIGFMHRLIERLRRYTSLRRGVTIRHIAIIETGSTCWNAIAQRL
jgi:hypothetical protein